MQRCRWCEHPVAYRIICAAFLNRGAGKTPLFYEGRIKTPHRAARAHWRSARKDRGSCEAVGNLTGRFTKRIRSRGGSVTVGIKYLRGQAPMPVRVSAGERPIDLGACFFLRIASFFFAMGQRSINSTRVRFPQSPSALRPKQGRAFAESRGPCHRRSRNGSRRSRPSDVQHTLLLRRAEYRTRRQ